ncbi:probable E3 ubiquitin-protein ligase ATL44 [Triticum urartu]|uniref:probable E3 ubiquitin-protein ligase ATL44 n=1 Tax=Triticum urartu TaxID=4572 RepID=UPI00204414F2|nr:probable E3 ubiquitin-protein ligase ATL44 [Triticum urartu]
MDINESATLAPSGTGGTSASSPALPHQPPEQAADSDLVVILPSMLCALVCVLGLALASRCACRRRHSSPSSSSSNPFPKGLKKKAINALPTISFAAAASLQPAATECAICLAEFAEGEGVRVLPRCGHTFHVLCIHAWLRTCATCPSCCASIAAAPAPAPTLVVIVAGNNRCGRCDKAAALAGGGDSTFLP